MHCWLPALAAACRGVQPRGEGREGSAPAARRAATLQPCPPSAARSSGVQQEWSLALQPAPAARLAATPAASPPRQALNSRSAGSELGPVPVSRHGSAELGACKSAMVCGSGGGVATFIGWQDGRVTLLVLPSGRESGRTHVRQAFGRGGRRVDSCPAELWQLMTSSRLLTLSSLRLGAAVDLEQP